MPRDVDRSHLHPVLRNILVPFDKALLEAGLPLELFEGARSPFRQAALFATGRTTGPIGKTVTRAKAWQSGHQHGCAVDYVFRDANGNWTWTEPTPGAWVRYTQIAASVGLRSLSFERPHVELPLSLVDLQAGRYPAGGDETWLAWLEGQIEQWGPAARDVDGIIHPGAPPLPTIRERPPLDGVA